MLNGRQIVRLSSQSVGALVQRNLRAHQAGMLRFGMNGSFAVL
jgi:hypothetical protein